MRRAKTSGHSDKAQTLIDNAVNAIREFDILINTLAGSMPHHRNYHTSQECEEDREVASMRIMTLQGIVSALKEDVKIFTASNK